MPLIILFFVIKKLFVMEDIGFSIFKISMKSILGISFKIRVRGLELIIWYLMINFSFMGSIRVNRWLVLNWRLRVNYMILIFCRGSRRRRCIFLSCLLWSSLIIVNTTIAWKLLIKRVSYYKKDAWSVGKLNISAKMNTSITTSNNSL